MNTDMSAFMGLSPNNDLKYGLIRAESVFLALYMMGVSIWADMWPLLWSGAAMNTDHVDHEH